MSGAEPTRNHVLRARVRSRLAERFLRVGLPLDRVATALEEHAPRLGIDALRGAIEYVAQRRQIPFLRFPSTFRFNGVDFGVRCSPNVEDHSVITFAVMPCDAPRTPLLKFHRSIQPVGAYRTVTLAVHESLASCHSTLLDEVALALETAYAWLLEQTLTHVRTANAGAATELYEVIDQIRKPLEEMPVFLYAIVRRTGFYLLDDAATDLVVQRLSAAPPLFGDTPLRLVNLLASELIDLDLLFTKESIKTSGGLDRDFTNAKYDHTGVDAVEAMTLQTTVHHNLPLVIGDGVILIAAYPTALDGKLRQPLVGNRKRLRRAVRQRRPELRRQLRTLMNLQRQRGADDADLSPEAPAGELDELVTEVALRRAPEQYFALLSYELAEARLPQAALTDAAAFEYLKEHGAMLLDDLRYELPRFDTWSRNVRRAREKLGRQKRPPIFPPSHTSAYGVRSGFRSDG